MKEHSKIRIYKKIIIKILREKKLTIEELVTSLNEILKSDFNMEEISRRTFDRAKKSLIESGYKITSKKFNGRNFFVLQEFPENQSLTEEEQLTFPLLLGLLETEKTMNSVAWLKDALMNEFDYSEDDLISYPYFVHVQPSLNNQDELLILSGRIIDYIKKGQAIQFLYYKLGKSELKQVAPLQIRYYDNRYYMLGSTIDESTKLPTNQLQTFTLDMFEENQVYPAIIENDECTIEINYIYFDYADLYKKTNLEVLLKNSLGIWYKSENNILKTFKLKFSDWAVGILKNKKLHHSQRIIEEAENYLIMEISVWDNPEIDYFLAKFRDKCEKLN